MIVLDVVVTGRLAEDLRQLVRSAGADVVGIASLTIPHGHSRAQVRGLRTLSEIEMDLADPTSGECVRCKSLPLMRFNPVSACMTMTSSNPQSPSQFLAKNAEALEFWKIVDDTNAYEHHRKEGDTHFIGFIDTKKMLEFRPVGRELVQKLVRSFAHSSDLPDVFLVPRRSRAVLLAKMVIREIQRTYGEKVQLVEVRRQRTTKCWQIRPEDRLRLFKANIMILDTAAGHGRTIDRLATVAKRIGASQVGAAVILSRLLPYCEHVFRTRFAGNFYRLFNFPVRPVAIRGTNIDLCPVCHRKRAIRQIAAESEIDALQKWADRLSKSRRFSQPEKSTKKSKVQLRLFEESFFSHCKPAVASGVTLHAISMASTNGSVPLTLPELFDETIPWRSRASMVENLPTGMLSSSQGFLVKDLCKCLAESDRPPVWKATANFLSGEGHCAWVDQLEPMLIRLRDCKGKTSKSFWNHMACNAYVLAAEREDLRAGVKSQMSSMLTTDLDQTTYDGIRQICDLI